MKPVDIFLWMAFAFLGFQMGSVFEKANTVEALAKGEIACEYHYGERVCWNPKEDEK